MLIRRTSLLLPTKAAHTRPRLWRAFSIAQLQIAQNRHFRAVSQLAYAASVMANSENLVSSRTSNNQSKRKFGKQLTHFLCFPLLSDEMLQLFGSSLKHFRGVTTAPMREHPLRARERAEVEKQRKLEEQKQASSGGDNSNEIGSLETPGSSAEKAREDSTDLSSSIRQDDPLGNMAKATSETFEESLKIIPSISHRPLGTYHLTIGVMNLSEVEEFKKCEEIFNSLDLKQLLKDAEKGPPPGSKVARKWKNSNKGGQNEKEEAQSAQAIEETSPNNDGKTEPLEISEFHRGTPIEPTLLSSEPDPIHISLLGVGAFNSPRRARVLYAHPHEQSLPHSSTTMSKPTYNPPFPDRLYNFALHIEAPFRAAGLIKETRPLTLHATLVNIRHKVQAKGGRTSKGKAWTHGRKRWDDGCVDARLLCTVFNEYSGDVEAAKEALGSEYSEEQDGDQHEAEDGQPGSAREAKRKQDDRDKGQIDHSKQFLWARDVPVNRVALCELGAKKSNDEFLGLEYPPVLEKWIFKEGI